VVRKAIKKSPEPITFVRNVVLDKLELGGRRYMPPVEGGPR